MLKKDNGLDNSPRLGGDFVNTGGFVNGLDISEPLRGARLSDGDALLLDDHDLLAQKMMRVVRTYLKTEG